MKTDLMGKRRSVVRLFRQSHYRLNELLIKGREMRASLTTLSLIREASEEQNL